MARLEPAPKRSPKRSRLVELWLPAAAALALAAAVLLLVIGRSAPVDRPAPAAALSPLAPKTAAATLPREPTVAIESVDFGEKPGTIFMVGGESGETACGALTVDTLAAGTWDPRFTIAGVTGHDGITPTVYDFAVEPGGSVIATGRFTYHEGQPVTPLLRLKEGQWQPVHESWTLEPPGDREGSSGWRHGPKPESSLVVPNANS